MALDDCSGHGGAGFTPRVSHNKMVSRKLKQLYYSASALPMRVNGMAYKWIRQPREPIRAHLGPGQRRYLPGWVNVDANWLTARIDVWANLLDPLPFRDESVEIFYSYHVLEHLPDEYLITHFRDMYRALVPGGGIRIGGPDTGAACAKYLAGDFEWFSSFPDPHSSIGGRFTNFVFCRGEHLTALSQSYLCEIAQQANFMDIRFCKPCVESSVVGAEVLETENEDNFEVPHTIILEARKPLHPKQ